METRKPYPNTIRIEAQLYTPRTDNKPTDHTVFFPGWAMKGTARSLSPLMRAFYDSLKQPAYAISTKSTTPINYTDRAQAVNQFLQERDIYPKILAGYSEGSLTAITLAMHLKNQGHPPDRLILLSPLGIEEYKNRSAAWRLFEQTSRFIPANTIGTIVNNPKEWKAFFRAGHAALDVIFGAATEILESKNPSKYLKTLIQEIDQMSMVSPILPQIDIPVSIIIGASDKMFDIWKTTRGEEEVEQLFHMLLPNCPQLNILVPKKFGSHGLPFVNPHRIANYLSQGIL